MQGDWVKGISQLSFFGSDSSTGAFDNGIESNKSILIQGVDWLPLVHRIIHVARTCTDAKHPMWASWIPYQMLDVLCPSRELPFFNDSPKPSDFLNQTPWIPLAIWNSHPSHPSHPSGPSGAFHLGIGPQDRGVNGVILVGFVGGQRCKLQHLFGKKWHKKVPKISHFYQI